MVNEDMEIGLSKSLMVERMNIYLATQGALPVYKEIQNQSVSSYWHSCSSPQPYKNALPGMSSQHPAS